MKLQASTVIDRPVHVVWDFYAAHHVANHPRWDPSVELEATSDDPIGLGTVIRRRVTRFGRTTEDTMEVVEFQPERAMRVDTHDGQMTIHGWVLFEPVGAAATKLTIGGDFVGMDESMAEQVRPMIERSATNIKSIIESER